MPHLISRSRPAFLLASAATLLLGACGGGGSSGGASSPPAPPPPPPPPTGSAPTYTPGVYQASAIFEDQCETPRTGVDIEGNAFPDEPGSLAEELFWLRSWTDETYLWRDEVTDRNPNNFNDTDTFFGLLKTNATTPSGAPKDDFHFSQPTEDYLRDRNSEPLPGYGANLVAFSTTPPRDFRVAYAEPGSPASTVVTGQQNLIRGSRILTVDGADLINGNSQAILNTLNNGLFPDTVGESHNFTVRDPDGTERAITLTAANIVEQPVHTSTVISTPSGPVGYIHFTTFSPFSSEAQIANAMRDMQAAGVSDLVLDLRYNGGGLLAVASQTAYMIAGNARTSGATFEQLQFNDRAGNTNPVTGEFNGPIRFLSTGQGFSLANGSSLPALNLDRVFILSTPGTCSASEAVINGLRGVDVEVVLIGDITCGKPYGFYPTNNCGETYYTIQFQGVNNKGFGNYADGFVPQNSSFAFGARTPGCVVADDFSASLGDPSEGLLAAALRYRDDGTCPAPPAAATSEKGPSSNVAQTGGLELDLPPTSPLERNRDLSMPGDYLGRQQ